MAIIRTMQAMLLRYAWHPVQKYPVDNTMDNKKRRQNKSNTYRIICCRIDYNLYARAVLGLTSSEELRGDREIVLAAGIR
jgi:hypothetical protein